MNKIWVQRSCEHVRPTEMFGCIKELLQNARRIWIVFWFVSYILHKDWLSGKDSRRKEKIFARNDWSWIVQRNSKWIDSDYWTDHGSKKKDEFRYKFDRYTATGKIDGDFEMVELLFIDKYWRTHQEFMQQPKDIIDWLLIKRSSEAKAQKKKNTFRSKK